MKSLIFGIGVNDANYTITHLIDDKNRRQCPYYAVWHSMLSRCYSEKQHMKQPHYIGCSVVPEWLHFMKFREWMIDQNWKGNQIDKDLLVKGNKVYGPDTCIFVSPQVNKFMTESRKSKGKWPVGVAWSKSAGKFQSGVQELGKGRKYLGLFDTPEEAHVVYVKEKAILAKELASQQTDHKIRDALLVRYNDEVIE